MTTQQSTTPTEITTEKPFELGGNRVSLVRLIENLTSDDQISITNSELYNKGANDLYSDANSLNVTLNILAGLGVLKKHGNRLNASWSLSAACKRRGYEQKSKNLAPNSTKAKSNGKQDQLGRLRHRARALFDEIERENSRKGDESTRLLSLALEAIDARICTTRSGMARTERRLSKYRAALETAAHNLVVLRNPEKQKEAFDSWQGIREGVGTIEDVVPHQESVVENLEEHISGDKKAISVLEGVLQELTELREEITELAEN